MKLIKRLLVAVFFIPIILFLFYKGNITFIIFLSALSLIMSFEYRNMLMKQGIKIPIITIPVNVIVFILLIKYSYALIFPIFLLLLILISGYDIFRNRIEGSLMRIASIMFGVLYMSFLLSSVYKLRELSQGNILLVSLIALIWLTDSAAFFIGSHFGKHKGVIKVSPNKSAEGFVSGILSAIIFSLALYFWHVVNIEQAIMLAVSVGFFGQFGDLFESMIKRDMGVKDSSNFLPGHGGILDRFDSLLIASPVLYVLLIIFTK